jgi:hypothetical protein
MKKAVLVIAALVLFTGFTFAQASVGAWGRGLFVLYGGGENDDMTMGTQTSWGGDPRVGMTISGSSDNVGFQADFNVDGNNGLNLGDNRKIWVKPIDMLTIQIGNFYDDTLRGNAVFGAWNWIRYDVITGEGALFGRVGEKSPASFEIALAPVEGAYIFVATTQQLLGKSLVANEVGCYVQAGAAYTIEGIGQIALQYVPETVYLTSSSGEIQGTFKLTMVEGLLVQLGVAYPIEEDQKDYELKAVLYGSYAMDALTIHVLGELKTQDTVAGNDMGFGFGLGVDYALEGGLGINADVRYNNNANTGLNEAGTDWKYPDGAMSGMIGLTMGFSNGLIGLGVEITTGSFSGAPAKQDAGAIQFALPIKLEYWF